MKLVIKKLTYQLFYVTSFLTLLAVIFAEGMLVYFKPPVIISLCFLYLVHAERKNIVVLLSLLLILICEVLFFKDNKGNFKMINILLSLYYWLNIILLSKSLQVVKIRIKRIFTVQLLISMVLIGYVLYSVTHLIMPQVKEQSSFLGVLVFSFAMFIGVCYYIYLNSKTVISYSLMVAASCFLIANILTALNRYYVYLEVFPVISTIIQIFGQFFLVKFFIERHKLKPNDNDYF